MLRVLTTAERTAGGRDAPPRPLSHSWAVAVVRRELCAPDQVGLSLPAHFPWILGRNAVINYSLDE